MPLISLLEQSSLFRVGKKIFLYKPILPPPTLSLFLSLEIKYYANIIIYLDKKNKRKYAIFGREISE